MKAKIDNSISIDQGDRNDVKHVAMMILCVRSFIKELAGQVAIKEISERPSVNILEEVWWIVTGHQAAKAALLWGFDFSTVWPHEDLKDSRSAKIARWLEHRCS